jgi:hypothetical protein
MWQEEFWSESQSLLFVADVFSLKQDDDDV